MAKVTVPQHIGDFRHAHRRTWVTGVRLLHGIDRQHANRTSYIIIFWGVTLRAAAIFQPPEKHPL